MTRVSKRGKLTGRELELWKAELAAAEHYLCQHVKLTKLQHVPDGKHDLILQIKWPQLVDLMARHSIQRVCDLTARERGPK